jgi:hypothetical protein
MVFTPMNTPQVCTLCWTCYAAWQRGHNIHAGLRLTELIMDRLLVVEPIKHTTNKA